MHKVKGKVYIIKLNKMRIDEKYIINYFVRGRKKHNNKMYQ